MITIWGIIGVCVGLVMGLTGAGGAIISVPMFIKLGSVSVQEATVYSLFTVWVGAVFNWWFQRRQTVWLASVMMAGFSLGGSVWFTEVKKRTPDWGILSLFIGVCLFSLWSVWRSSSKNNQTKENLIIISFRPSYLLKFALSGITLGALTTMTGLGGGVLLLPWLLGPLRVPAKQAVPTSLLTIALAVSGAIYSQHTIAFQNVNLNWLIALVFGVFTSAMIIRTLIKKLPEHQLVFLRKWIFTGVVLLSVLTLLL